MRFYDRATSWCFAAADTSIEIYGTEGSILLSGVDIASRPTRETDFLRIFRRGEENGGWSASPVVPSFKTGVFHEHVAWAFVEALKQGGPMPVTIDDGLRAFAMIDGAYRAAAAGRAQVIAYPSMPSASRS
jgi:myo-inositol 2-dehydrogenase / D-chiro-inositol 1-dehydrogenase